MKNKLKGFVEGTQSVTSGDKMKLGDHERLKFHCKYFHNGRCLHNKHNSIKCMGSSHCEHYDDGIPILKITETESNKAVIENLNKYINELKYKIDFDSLEGKYIRLLIKKENQLTTDEIKKAEQEEKTFLNKKRILENEIQSYNDSLKTKCILAGLLIITAPFCYFYYQSNKRTVTTEMIRNLENTIIDRNLQKKVYKYNSEINQYKQISQSGQKNNLTYDIKDYFYKSAIMAYKEKNLINFKINIIKSIESHNNNAVIYLSNKYKSGEFGTENKHLFLTLLLFSSYIGDKQSTRFFANKLLKLNKNSKIGQKFLEKSLH